MSKNNPPGDPKVKVDPPELSASTPRRLTQKETTVPEKYILTGLWNELNNYDEFSWWMAGQFQDIGLWDIETNSPNHLVSTTMLLRNLHPDLHSKYRNCINGKAVWDLIVSLYAGKQSNTQGSVLTGVVAYQPPVDIDVALQLHEKNVRKMMNAFGKTMDTELVVQILFAKNLPQEYATPRLAAIASPSFDFDTLKYSISAIWDDIKVKKVTLLVKPTMRIVFEKNWMISRRNCSDTRLKLVSRLIPSREAAVFILILKWVQIKFVLNVLLAVPAFKLGHIKHGMWQIHSGVHSLIIHPKRKPKF